MSELLMSSRRTIMSGEVVTFATRFLKGGCGPITGYVARGPFEVSASRDAVIVHEAQCHDEASLAKLHLALHKAEAAMRAMKKQSYGAPSLYPSEPTPVSGANQ